jgi:hypothetical protein
MDSMKTRPIFQIQKENHVNLHRNNPKKVGKWFIDTIFW